MNFKSKPYTLNNPSVILALMMFLLTGLSACSDNVDLPQSDDSDFNGEAGYITIYLKSGNLSSRAEEEGIDNLNENLIKSVTVCLTPSGGDNTANVPPVFMETFSNVNSNGKALIRIPLTMSLTNSLFLTNGDNKCKVFAAVNVNPGTAKTEADLRALTVSSTFATKQVQESFTMDGDDFITYDPSNNLAYGEVELQRSAAKITLSLNVEKSIEEVLGENNTIIWEPNLDGMYVMLQQGVQKSTLDPRPTSDMDPEVYFNTATELTDKYDFKLDNNAPDKTETGLNYKYDWVQNIPFYTYPNKWTDSKDETHGTFMMLTVPWTSDGGKTYRTCYYHVPVVKTGTYENTRNVSYHINLHVAVLGSFVPEEPMELEADYYAAEWGKEDLDVEIKDYRYLVVDQNDYVVNNENSITIPFYTSHPTEVIAAKMVFYRYNFSDEGSEFAVTVDEGKNKMSEEKAGEYVFETSFNNEEKTLTVFHNLKIFEPYDANGVPVDLTNGADVLDADNSPTRPKLQTAAEIKAVLDRISYFKMMADQGTTNVALSNDEFSRVEFEITVQHSDVADGTSGIDKRLYQETVTITQYPGIYITAVKNYAGLLGTSRANGALGNTMINSRYGNEIIDYTRAYSSLPSGVSSTYYQASVNANQALEDNWGNWSYSLGLSSSFLNWNPNIYMVTITNLPEGTDYIIRDPRILTINNNLSNESMINPTSENTKVWNEGIKRIYRWYKRPLNSNGSYASNADWCKSRSNYYDIRLGFISAPDINSNVNRTLSYYYPTDESDGAQYYIAPKFRICSSYGGTSAYLTREMARRRAAAYQELGYAAGRWRLPTLGEVKFVMELSRQNKIPRLFGQNQGVWYYWCAQGAVKVPGRGDKTSVIEIVANPGEGTPNSPDGGSAKAVEPFTGNNYRDHARFVYDEWYWRNDTVAKISPNATPNSTSPIYTFTWGDRLKDNPQQPQTITQ